MSAGLLVVIAGPSGVGKTTIRQALVQRHPGDYFKSVSATTRPARPGEIHGQNYFFLSLPEFQDWIARGEFLEYAQYQNQYYGTPRPFVLEQVALGHVVLLDIDVQGMLQLRTVDLPVLTIFVRPPNFEELVARLRNRGTEAPAQIAGRIERAKFEMSQIDRFDRVVVNDDLDQAVQNIERHIEEYRHNPSLAPRPK